MPAGQAEEIIALALVFAVHVVGGVLLVWALLAPRSPSGDGRALAPPLPLRDAEPSRTRLREPVRVADAYERPLRRPGHPPVPPAPRPAPAPARRRRSL